jgi:hypothetical protein
LELEIGSKKLDLKSMPMFKIKDSTLSSCQRALVAWIQGWSTGFMVE